MAGLPVRREPWRVRSVEAGIGARRGAPALAGPSHAHDRRPADPDHARRPPRRGRAAARPDHLRRAAARRRDHPRRPRHRRDPGGGLSRSWTTYYWFLQHGRWAWLAVWQALLAVLATLFGPPVWHVVIDDTVVERIEPGPRLARAPQPRRQAEPVAVPARPGLAVPGRGGRVRRRARPRGAACAPSRTCASPSVLVLRRSRWCPAPARASRGAGPPFLAAHGGKTPRPPAALCLATIAGKLAPDVGTRCVALQLRLHEHEPSAPAASLSDGLVRPSPEGPGQDEGRRRRGTGEREPGDQAADLRDAERDEGLAGGSRAPFSLFRPARSPASRASASMARVTCRCQPRQLLTS